MKNIKIKYIGFWDGFDPCDNLFYNTIKDRYNVEISDTPDYLICSCLCEPFEYAKYDCIRIQYIGENLAPDFSSFDYVIGFDDIKFNERYLKYPLSLYAKKGEYSFAPRPTEEEAYNILKQKQYFCNFIYSHQSNSDKRETIYKALSDYKKVEAAGTFWNNQPEGKNVRGASKLELLKRSKFTIAGESVIYPGFNTEKIVHPFECCSVPIYSGDPDIKNLFNPKSFIYMEDFETVKDLTDYIISIDTDDKKYVEMLMQPPVAPGLCSQKYEEFKLFLFDIFDKDISSARKRMNCFASYSHDLYHREYNTFYKSLPFRIMKKLGKL